MESERGVWKLYWPREELWARTQGPAAPKTLESWLFNFFGILGKLIHGYSIYYITQMFQKMKIEKQTSDTSLGAWQIGHNNGNERATIDSHNSHHYCAFLRFAANYIKFKSLMNFN